MDNFCKNVESGIVKAILIDEKKTAVVWKYVDMPVY